VIILLLKIAPHLKCVATLPCEMSSVLRQFSPLGDDRLLQLVDCRESSTLIDHLLNGTQTA